MSSGAESGDAGRRALIVDLLLERISEITYLRAKRLNDSDRILRAPRRQGKAESLLYYCSAQRCTCLSSSKFSSEMLNRNCRVEHGICARSWGSIYSVIKEK